MGGFASDLTKTRLIHVAVPCSMFVVVRWLFYCDRLSANFLLMYPLYSCERSPQVRAMGGNGR
jgi:hypothetical protein